MFFRSERAAYKKPLWHDLSKIESFNIFNLPKLKILYKFVA